jgi:hypothetical protein
MRHANTAASFPAFVEVASIGVMVPYPGLRRFFLARTFKTNLS